MNFLVVGTNHKYSPIALREKLSFSKKRLKDTLNFLREKGILRGSVILSTCNRVEIYASTEGSETGIRQIEDFICQYHEIDKQKIFPYLYVYENREAMRHLFSVACGLDSLILGETQILGQLNFSFSEAENARAVDKFLRQIFSSAIFFAKRIHTQTRLSEGKVSIGSVAIDFIKKKIGTLQGKSILIIGVGKVTELVLQYLKKEEPNVVFISNRTFEKARKLAAQIKAMVVRFDDLKKFLDKADVVITATASPHFIIRKENFKNIVDHKLLIIDLSLPRDVAPDVKEIRNIDLFYLEDLDIVIKKNVERKNQEAKKAKRIRDIEVEKLWAEFTKLEQEPALLL